MADHKNFYKADDNVLPNNKNHQIKRDENGKIHVAVFSKVFSEANEHLLTSNSMYANLLADVKPCFEPYPTKENIVLEVYETKESDDFVRESVVIGFRRYVSGCLKSLCDELRNRIILFSSFLLIGVFVEILIFGILPENAMPEWLSQTLHIFASLFIWQFGGYVAFEFLGESKKISRFKQIQKADIAFKHWD